MKTMMLILPLTAAALLASAAGPAQPETPSSDATAMSATKNSLSNAAPGGLDSADKAYDARLGEELARSGAVTAKPKRSIKKIFLQSLNAFAPMKPAPTTPWLSREPWSAVATAEHENASRPIETNREVKLKVTIWRD